VTADDASAIGERLRQLRQAKGMSQEHAAHAVGVASKTWNSWETGRRFPRMGNLERIGEEFEVDPSDLLPPDRLAAIEERLDRMEEAIAKLLPDEPDNEKGPLS